MSLLSRLLVEFIGTFFLCLVIAMNGDGTNMKLLAVGAVLIGIIYGGGPISGAHYNPAVTLAFYLRRRIKLIESIWYISIQLLAALAAAALSIYIFSTQGDGNSAINTLGAGLTAEFLGTFALVFVILSVATLESTAGNQYYGLAIAAIVVACAYVFGPYSGAAFNPAVAFSQSLTSFYAWGDYWIYLVASVVAAIIVSILFNRLADPTRT